MLPRLLRGQARAVPSMSLLHSRPCTRGRLHVSVMRWLNARGSPSDLGLLEDRTCFRLTTSRSEALF